MSSTPRNQSVEISKNVTLDLIIWRENGTDIETECNLQGNFVVHAEARNDFAEKLANLIDEYRI